MSSKCRSTWGSSFSTIKGEKQDATLSLSLSLFLLLIALAGSAQAQSGSTNACVEVDVSAGQSFVWTNTYPTPVVVSLATSTGASGSIVYGNQPPSFTIPANGSLTVIVPQATSLGTYNLTVAFAPPNNGNPCPTAAVGGGKIKIQN